MTVAFTEESEPADGLPALRPLLTRVLNTRLGIGTPDAVLRALVTCTINSGHHPAAARHFVLGEPRAVDLVPLLARSSWYPLVASTRAYLRATDAASGGARAKRLPWARIGIARAVSPMPEGHGVSTRMEARLRIAMLVIAARALETGWDQILVTRSWLALEMNVRPGQAGKVLAGLEAIKWIRRVRGGGGGLRYRFCALDTDELRHTSWAYSTAIDSLADGRPEDDELAQLVSVIRHPAWAYAEALGHRAWLRLALPHMPTSDGRLGLGPASYRALTKALDHELPGALAREIDIAAVLDDYAETSLAVYVYEDRRIDLQTEAMANRERLMAHRLASDLKWEAIKGAQRTLRAAWEAIGRVPDAVPTDESPTAAAHQRDLIREWVDAAARHFAANPVEPEALAPLRVQLLGILTARGHDEALTNRITDHILPVD